MTGRRRGRRGFAILVYEVGCTLRVFIFLEDQAGLLLLHPSPFPLPSIFKLNRQHTGRPRKRDNVLGY
jgi:hypothetical protein